MSKEEDFFKENFPEYVTEKGEYLSPYWDLFNAGVICVNFELKEENRQLKDEVEDLRSYCNQIGKVKTEVLKAFEHIVAK